MVTHSSILAGESQGEKCLVDYSPQDYKESDTTEATQRTHTHTHTQAHTHTHTHAWRHIFLLDTRQVMTLQGPKPGTPSGPASWPAPQRGHKGTSPQGVFKLFPFSGWRPLSCLIQPQHGAEVKSKNSAKRCEAHYLTFLCLNFPICKMGTMLVIMGL